MIPQDRVTNPQAGQPIGVQQPTAMEPESKSYAATAPPMAAPKPLSSTQMVGGSRAAADTITRFLSKGVNNESEALDVAELFDGATKMVGPLKTSLGMMPKMAGVSIGLQAAIGIASGLEGMAGEFGQLEESTLLQAPWARPQSVNELIDEIYGPMPQFQEPTGQEHIDGNGALYAALGHAIAGMFGGGGTESFQYIDDAMNSFTQKKRLAFEQSSQNEMMKRQGLKAKLDVKLAQDKSASDLDADLKRIEATGQNQLDLAAAKRQTDTLPKELQEGAKRVFDSSNDKEDSVNAANAVAAHFRAKGDNEMAAQWDRISLSIQESSSRSKEGATRALEALRGAQREGVKVDTDAKKFQVDMDRLFTFDERTAKIGLTKATKEALTKNAATNSRRASAYAESVNSMRDKWKAQIKESQNNRTARKDISAALIKSRADAFNRGKELLDGLKDEAKMIHGKMAAASAKYKAMFDKDGELLENFTEKEAADAKSALDSMETMLSRAIDRFSETRNSIYRDVKDFGEDFDGGLGKFLDEGDDLGELPTGEELYGLDF